MLGSLIVHIADLYATLIVIYVLLSWFPHNRGVMAGIYDALATLCEPYLGLFRKVIPPAAGLDFSPVVAVIVLELAVRLIIALL